MRIRSIHVVLAGLLSAAQFATPAFAQSTAGTPPQAAASTAPNPAPAHPELAGVFEQFGGIAGLTALNEEFMALMLADPRLEPYFRNVDRPRVTRQLTEQFCAVLGGGCAYSGRDMVEAHAAFKIERAELVPFRQQHHQIGALRRAMATTGYTEVKEFQRVEVVVHS